MRHPVVRHSAILLVLSLTFSACSRDQGGPGASSAVPAVDAAAIKARFDVERFELGTAVDGEKKVVAPATRFKASDTIYASVVGSGHAPRVTLRTRWLTSSGRLTFDASQYVMPSGPTVAEFHSPSPNNWPAGKYKIDLTVDTLLVGTAEFTIAD